MHSYIIVGTDEKLIDQKISGFEIQGKRRNLPFTIEKIDDVRDLGKFLKTVKNDTNLIIKNIDSAGIEAQNALLKHLEEPPIGIIFILTVVNEDGVLPTIMSRCQTIYVSKQKTADFKESEDFFKKKVSEQILNLSKFSKKQSAIDLMEQLVRYLHLQIVKGDSPKKNSGFLKSAEETLTNIKANGNVYLQLLNFFVNIH